MIARTAIATVLLACGPLAVAADAGAVHPGFGFAKATGTTWCATIEAADVTPGERVALVFPSLPQHVSWATVQAVDRTAQCASLHAMDVPGQAFILRLQPPLPAADDPIAIVVRGARGFDRRHTRIVARLPGGDAWFRTCTSSEGLHLGAWPKAGTSGRPLWHAYVYLGYDTESDCSDAETRDAAPRADSPTTTPGTTGP